MVKAYQKKRVIAKQGTVYVGMDVHKDSWHVTARKDGEDIFNVNMPAQYEALMKLFERFKGCSIKAAYEAGPCGFWLHDKLMADGIETIVVPPSLIPVESGNRVKTDKRDSRKLAKLLESNMLKQVYVLTEEERTHRELVRTRRQLLEHRTGVMRQIKGKLLFHGIKSPFKNDRWTISYVKWLKELACQQVALKISLEVLIGLYEYLTQQQRSITKQMVLLIRNPKYAKKINLLKTVPGIGTLIAIEILVELQNMERFSSAQKLASYTGLTPSEYSSGQSVQQGRITRCGNKRVRTCLVEASWILIHREPAMRQKYLLLKNRKGGKRAIIAIARMLILRIRRILLNNEPYIMKAAA
jgi:transposase